MHGPGSQQAIVFYARWKHGTLPEGEYGRIYDKFYGIYKCIAYYAYIMFISNLACLTLNTNGTVHLPYILYELC